MGGRRQESKGLLTSSRTAQRSAAAAWQSRRPHARSQGAACRYTTTAALSLPLRCAVLRYAVLSYALPARRAPCRRQSWQRCGQPRLAAPPLEPCPGTRSASAPTAQRAATCSSASCNGPHCGGRLRGTAGPVGRRWAVLVSGKAGRRRRARTLACPCQPEQAAWGGRPGRRAGSRMQPPPADTHVTPRCAALCCRPA